MTIQFGGDPIPGFDPVSGTPLLTPNNAFLKVVSGPGLDRLFPLRQMRLVVGRNDPPTFEADIDLTDCEISNPPSVSRRHAEFQWIDGELHVVDLSSRNGTYINGERLVAEPKHPSASVVLRSSTMLTFANIETEIIVIDRIEV